MKAFHITVNGKRTALAGVGGQGVLTVMVVLNSNKNDDILHLDVGGLISSTGTHVMWPSPQIKMGDEIVIKIVDSDTVDEPMD